MHRYIYVYKQFIYSIAEKFHEMDIMIYIFEFF